MDRNSQEWVPDSVLAMINAERVYAPAKSNEELAREILMSSAPMAAKSSSESRSCRKSSALHLPERATRWSSGRGKQAK